MAALRGTLAQGWLDRVASTVNGMVGGLREVITYHAKSTSDAVAVDYPGIAALTPTYDDHITALHALTDAPQVLREDIQCMVPVSAVEWVPTIYDTITRADGTRWRVLDTKDGAGSPFWIMHIRRIKV